MLDGFWNTVLSAVAAAAFLAVLGWLWKRFETHRTREKIRGFLREGDYEFRSTEAISAATNLSAARVEQICAGDPMIRRNQLEKESWKIEEG